MLNFTGILSSAGTGAAAGSAIPGVGTVAGGIIGGATSFISGLFGGGVPGHEHADEDKIAAAVGITRDQAGWLCGMVEEEAGKGGPNYDDIVKDYASHPEEILGLIPRYNRKHPESAIYPQQTGSTANQGINTQAQMQAGYTYPSAAGASAVTAPSTATPPYLPNTPATTSAANNAPTTTDHTTTYALIGGGALALIIVLILLLKK
ncbi:MAG: hypothetical protein ACRYFZ_00970 [Janthinobacterium lividum]